MNYLNLTYRQGDLLFIARNEKPVKSKLASNAVLAYGETTGHSHRLVGGVVWTHDRVKYIELEAPAQVVHEEHLPVTLPAGTYEVRRQRQYRENESRRVDD